MGKIGEMIVALGADNKNLKKGMKESQGIIQSTMDTISNMKGELLSIGAVAGPIAAIRSWAGAVNTLEDATGMAAESASKLLAMGQYVGISTEEMSTALNKMSKNAMAAAVSIDTASASGGTSTDVFTRYGISILDANGKLLSAEQIMDNVASKHRSLANGVEKTAMEMEIFGRSGAKLNDLLNMSTQEMQEVKDMAQKTGLVLNHETSQGFENAEFAVNKSKMAMQGLAASIGAQMLPEITKLTGFMVDATEKFAALDEEERRNITTALEVAAAVSAISIGWRGLVYLSEPFIAALGNLTKAYTALKIAALGASGAMGIATGGVAAVVGANAYLMTQSLPDEEQTRETFANQGLDPDKYLGEKGSLKLNTNPLIGADDNDGYSKYSSDDYDKTSEGFNPYDAKTTQAGGTIDFSGKGGAGKADKSAEQAIKEISEINKQMSELQQKANDFAADWSQAELEIAKAAADGGALVLANIYTEGEARKKSVDDWLGKVNDATIEAQQIYERAVKSGDESAIASATAMLEERKNAEIQAAQEAADAKKEIDRQTTDELMSNATALQAFKAEIDEAMRQGDYERFMQSMTDENVAFAEQMAEKQAVMQQYYDWRMEAEQSFTMFALQAAEQLKTSLGQAAANTLIYGKSFKTAIKDMVKSLAAMYVQWAVEKMAASALSRLLMKQETSAVAAQGTAMATALAPAAWAKLVLSPGSAAIATGLLTAGMSAAAAIGGAVGALSGTGSAGGNTSSAPGGGLPSGLNVGGIPGMATGGVVTAPTLALIGEGRDDEAVIPLRKGIFEELFGGAGQVLATQNIYGDINTGADSDDMYSDFGSMIISGLRGR